MLHFAPSFALRHRILLQAKNEYLATDLEQPDVDIHMDITDILFKDNTFDVIICSHVLEHVPDDSLAMRELYRILRPGGWALLQVPMDETNPSTFEDVSITSPAQRKQFFGQEDHVRMYGKDFQARLESAGFKVSVIDYTKELSDRDNERYGFRLGQDKLEDIYICTK